MKRILCAALTAFSVFAYAGDDDDPPPVEPGECCAEGRELQGTYTPPKCGAKDDTHPEIGEMSDVFIFSGPVGVGMDISGNGLAIEYSGGATYTFYAVGGGDTDVCVETDPPDGQCPKYNGRGVDTKYEWSSDEGYADPNDPSKFIFAPTEPGEYEIELSSVEDGDCNAGGESKTTTTKIVLYSISGIYPDVDADSLVFRGDTETFSVIVEFCELLSGYPKWTSTATSEVGTGLSWGGKHCVGYDLNVDVKVFVTLPLEVVQIRKVMSKKVNIGKRETFNCTVVNNTKRYPVPLDYIGGRSGTEMVTDACNNGSYGITWDYPYPLGANQGTAMSLSVNVGSVSSGPNSGWHFVEDMNDVIFDIDTNTNISFTPTIPTVWYSTHTLEADALHAQMQAHEETHIDNARNAEEDMPLPQCGVPGDMYDACEPVCSSATAQDVRDMCAFVLEARIDQLKNLRLYYYEELNRNDCPTCCDYYAFGTDPGRFRCPPGVTPGTYIPCTQPALCP